MNEPSKVTAMPSWAMPAISWLVSFYFLLGFCFNVGFPPRRALILSDALYVVVWLLFLFLPFLRKIKIGSFLELERELDRTRDDLQHFKSEIRSSINVLSTTVNTIGSFNNHMTVNVPGLPELQRVRREVEQQTPREALEDAKGVKQELNLEGDDMVLALARTRIEIERQLRKILGKSTTSGASAGRPIRFLSARNLFEMFLQEHQQYAYLQRPFQYVMEVCSAAIHAQRVSDEQAREALAIGANLIATLAEQLDSKNSNS